MERFGFGLKLNVPVNSYGHPCKVISPNHTFFLGKLDYAVNQYFVHILRLLLTTTILELAGGRRNYFMINLHESTGPGQNQTRDPWICSQTRY